MRIYRNEEVRLVIVFVQARMRSTRLPGKALTPIAGCPLLLRVVERLKMSQHASKIVVTTSTEMYDDPIAQACNNWKVECFRGPEEDVLIRLLLASIHYRTTSFVRISGDSPLIDPNLVDHAIRLHTSVDGTDLTTNVLERTFPAGQSVEVISSSALNRVLYSTKGADREHVTQGFYHNMHEYAIVSFTSGKPWGTYRHVVDTPDDLWQISQLLEGVREPLGGCGEIVSRLA